MGSERGDRILAEAEVLQRISHPGVVEYVEHHTNPTVQLVTMFAGADAWDRQPPTGADSVHALAAVASTVADLHDAAIAHGELVAAHIIAGPDQRPVLCGFARSTPLSAESRAADLVALADLVEKSTADLDDDQGSRVAALGADLRRGRASARSATNRLDALLSHETPSAPARAVSRRVMAIAAATTFAVLALALLVPGRETRPDAASTVAPQSLAADPMSTTIAPAPAPPATVLTPPVVGAPTLVNNGRQYALGRPGDIAVVGDWDCNGSDTPALLRPSTGEVAVFADWPAPKSGITAQQVVIVEDARSLEVDDHDVCVLLRARTKTGSVLVPLESA